MIKLAQGRLALLTALVVVSLGLAALAAAAAYCVQLSVDALVAGEFIGGKAPLLASLFVAIGLTGAGLEVLRSWAAERLGLGYVADVRAQLFERLLQASPTVLAQRGQGGLLLPFVGDLTALKKWVSDGLVRLISATASGLLLLGALSYQSAPLGAAAGGIVALAALAVFLLSKPLNSSIKETRLRRGAVASFVSRSIRAAGSIRAFHRVKRESKRLESRNAALMRAGLGLALISGAMTGAVYVASLLLVATALSIGAIEVRAGELSIGGVVAAISVSGLLAASVRDLGVAFELWRRAAVSVGKIGLALNTELAVPLSRANHSPKDGAEQVISLRDVAAEVLFENVTANIVRGEIVNILGDSGAGKSTLLAIIARLRAPNSGRVRICGRDARDIDAATLRGMIGFAGASAPLLVGSVAMNLRYRSPSAPDRDVSDVIAGCNFELAIGRLPGGQAFRLSEGAPELSASERQRLQLARAMLGRPLILVLDDVDTHLDEESANRIAAFLSNYPGVVVMAATLPPLRRIATSVWRIENGKVQIEASSSDRLELIDGGVVASGRQGET